MLEWIRKGVDLGAGEILLTSMDMDGTLAGYDIELTKNVSNIVNVPLIASGGAGKAEHIRSVLSEGEADAALVASILHDGNVEIMDLKNDLVQHNIPVRVIS